MAKLRGINVYPLALAAILNELPEFAGEYVCRATRDIPTGRDDLTVIVEIRACRPGTRRGLARAAANCWHVASASNWSSWWPRAARRR
ncbi:MAG: hypothetical protein U1F18_06170 [Steroidobacteraceae bacterium]